MSAPTAPLPDLHHHRAVEQLDPLLSGHHPLGDIAEKVVQGERLTQQDGMRLAESNDLLAIGTLADAARKLKFEAATVDYVYWIHNYHINITNVCEGTCRFCAFSRRSPKAKEAYFLTVDQIVDQVAQYPGLADLAEFHIVSGMTPDLNLAYYVALFDKLSQHFPHVHIKGLTAAEIDYIANLDGLSHEDVLTTLRQHGHRSMPGGGAEVFSERIHRMLYPDKISHEQWLAIHGKAHQMGLKSTATMLCGLGETWQERVDHLLLVREQQDKTEGFTTFIPLNCWYDNTAVDASNALTGVENLKTFALSRLLLDNIDHIKGYWIQHGLKMAQISLSFGVNDLDGTVIQEKISHMAGTDTAQYVTKAELAHTIKTAGKIPVERHPDYSPRHIY
ncbi:MAG: CofH family radical SAM protein [Cyanobacteria bacterium HKST-UBA04]|nr:CofH family radical SAM protein [Cyanobacteria bacterium HKST-UBA04]MCA9841865.1 CofH family radical SAM protein [Cyanobacteria bacterium HKST-UBA03]